MTPLIEIKPHYIPGATGFFPMTAPEYFAAPGVSQSMLKQMARSPAHMKAYLSTPRKPTPSQEFGTLVHTALFETNLFGDAKSHYVKRLDFDGRTKNGKAWTAHHRDKPCLTAEEAEAIIGIHRSIRAHIYGAGLIGALGIAEVSGFFYNEELGLVQKIRPDRIVQRDDGLLFLLDAKTTDDASKEGFRREIEKWGYHRQAAYYLDVCAALGVEIADFLWLAVEKEPPYAVGVYNLTKDDIEVGRKMYRRELALYAKCEDEGRWPAYSEDIETISLSRWVRERV